MARHQWTPDDDAILLQLRMDGATHADVARAMGRTYKSCAQRAALLQRGEGKFQRPWSDDDKATLIRLREVERWDFVDIDAHLNRGRGCSGVKYRQLRGIAPVPKRTTLEPAAAPVPAVVTERAARAQLQHVTLTAAFCGDPLPGRSALDAKRLSSATTGGNHATHY